MWRGICAHAPCSSILDSTYTFCVSAVLEMLDGSERTVVLSASALAEAKTAKGEFDCIVEIVERGEKLLEMVVEWLKARGWALTAKQLPASDEEFVHKYYECR